METDCPKCVCNCTARSFDDPLIPDVLKEDALEKKFYMNFRLWHVLFMGFASVMAVVICICCCVRFRIPRTKQEIEADYVRKKITRKFQKQLQLIQNSEMDEMDLKKALERVRAEFPSDSESGDSNTNNTNDNDDSVFRSNSGANLGISADDLVEKQNRGLGSKVASFVGFLRPRKTQHNSPQKSSKVGV